MVLLVGKLTNKQTNKCTTYCYNMLIRTNVTSVSRTKDYKKQVSVLV